MSICWTLNSVAVDRSRGPCQSQAPAYNTLQCSVPARLGKLLGVMTLSKPLENLLSPTQLAQPGLQSPTARPQSVTAHHGVLTHLYGAMPLSVWHSGVSPTPESPLFPKVQDPLGCPQKIKKNPNCSLMTVLLAGVTIWGTFFFDSHASL